MVKLSFGIFNIGDVIELNSWNDWIGALNSKATNIEISKINKSSIWVKFKGHIGFRGYGNALEPIGDPPMNEVLLTVSNFRDIIKIAKDKSLYKDMKNILTRDDQLNGLLDDI